MTARWDAPGGLPADFLQSRLLYRDGLMLIIDKPAGIPVHAGPRGGVTLTPLLDSLRFGLKRAPELAHRLDRETSGCLVLGRHHKALARLGALFAEGKVEKVYWAVVVGAPAAQSGTIDAPLLKLERKHGWRMVANPKGQPSVTDWTVLGRSERLAWIEARPRTGRTHQIRAHLALMGSPIAGDVIYGRGTADMAADILHLHARSVAVPLSANKPPVRVTAPVPEHMCALLAACGWNPAAEDAGIPADQARA
ncbi:MAG: RNA pseudouridine synthase [Magnetospirillum sp.]|nr:RNA pseudouridine synthase [Magnetospirillum sp.]